MAFKIHKHDKHYFHAKGNNGDFKIAKKGLSPKQHEKYLAMFEGGKVQKFEDGGKVEPIKELPPVPMVGATGAPIGAARPANTSYPGNVSYTPSEGKEGEIDWELVADRAPHLVGNTLKQTMFDPMAGAVQGLLGMHHSNYLDKPVAAVRALTRGTKTADEMSRIGEAYGRPGNVSVNPQEDPQAYEKYAMDLFNLGAGLSGGQPGKVGSGVFGGVGEGGGAAPKIPKKTPKQLAAEAFNSPTGRTAVENLDFRNYGTVRDAIDVGNLLKWPRTKGGGYVGAPEWIDSPQKLTAARKVFEELVRSGAKGADWYTRAQGAIREMAAGNPHMENMLSDILAIYSPEATPGDNMGYALRQLWDARVNGPDWTADQIYRYGHMSKKAAEAIKRGGREGPDVYSAAGEKVEPYYLNINPQLAGRTKVRGVNDRWMGDVWKYPMTTGAKVGKKAGFSPSQHRFMDWQNLKALDNLVKEGVLPAEALETAGVGAVQAAPWVKGRFEKFKGEDLEAAANAKAKGKPYTLATDDELWTRALEGYDRENMERYTGYVTQEATTPGLGTGHVEGPQTPELLAMRHEANRGLAGGVGPHGEDVFLAAQEVPTRPVDFGTGVYQKDAASPVENNANSAARVVASPSTRDKNLKHLPSVEKIMEQDLAQRSLVDMQNMSAYHQVATKAPESAHNAARVVLKQDLTPEALKALNAQVEGAGLKLNPTGRNSFTITGENPEGIFGEISKKDFFSRFKGLGDTLAKEGADITTGKYLGIADFAPVGAEHAGTGAATERALGIMTPEYGARNDASPLVRQAYAAKRDFAIQAAKAIGGDSIARPDWVKLMGILENGGIEGLREYVRVNGSKGLPAATPFFLHGMPGTANMAPMEQHSQGGTVGEETGGLELHSEDEHYVHFIHPDGHRLSAAKVGLSPETLERFRGVKKYAGGGNVTEGGSTSLPVGMEPQNFTPAPNMTPAEAPPLSPEEQGASLRASWGQEPGIDAVQPQGGQAPAGEAPVESTEFTGRAAAEGETPFGLNAVWQGLKQDVGQGLKDWGAAADWAFPSSVGSKVLTPAGEKLQASAAEGMKPPEQPAQQGVPQYLARPQPEVAPVRQQQAPPMPQVPQMRSWGTGAPAEIEKGRKQVETAINEKAKAEENYLLQMQQVQNSGVAQAKVMFDKAKERYEKRQVEMDRMFDEVKNAKINPNRFLESKDTGQKILAGIGMLFSGMGSGLTGAPNMAMDVINRAIDRDIDAQKFNIHKQQNALSWYAKQTGDELTATSLLRAQLLDTVAGQIEGLKLGMNAATVAPAAMAAAGQLRMNAAQMRQQASLQELQGQQIQYDLAMKQYRMKMMQTMLGAGPGAGADGNHSDFIRTGVAVGAFEMKDTAKETVREAVKMPDGSPVIGKDGKVQMKPERVVMRLYPDAERAREAQHVYNHAPALKEAIASAQAILRSHPWGSNMLRDTEANAALQAEVMHISQAYENMVNGMNRQPNKEVLEQVLKTLNNPGGITSSLLGTSMAALSTFDAQTDRMVQGYRNGAFY